MYKLLLIAAGASVLALTAPPALQRMSMTEGESTEALDPPVAVVDAAAPAAATGRTARVAADASGHFRTDARLNGRTEAVMIDTGATTVALSETAARRLGIRLTPADFAQTARTAGGDIAVARATLDRVEIGGVTVRSVDAMVAKGDILKETLVGMSFLRKLRRFEVADGRLDLVE